MNDRQGECRLAPSCALAASKLEFDILKLKHLKTMMDNKEFSLNVTLALESAFEASMGGEVPGI